MATVVRFPSRPPKYKGLGQIAGLFLGQSLAESKRKEKARQAIEAYESVIGDKFDEATEEALVEQGVTMEDLASFAAEKRAEAEEDRREKAFPLLQGQRRESIESSELSQRRTRQQLDLARSREERAQSQEQRAQQQEEREQEAAERQARQSKDVEVELVNENTNEIRPAIVSRAVLRGEKQLPEELRSEGWSLSAKAAEEGKPLSGTANERAIKDFIITMGGDPDNAKDREAGRRALEGKETSNDIIKEAFGQKSGDTFTFPGKRKELFTTATALTERIIWNNHQAGKRVTPEQAAKIAIERAEQIHGGLEQPRPEEQVQTLRENVGQQRQKQREEDEPGIVSKVPIVGGLLSDREAQSQRDDPLAIVNSAVSEAPAATQDRLASLLAASRVNPAISILRDELGVEKFAAQQWVLDQINQGGE